MICYTNKYHIPFVIDDDDYTLVSQYSWCLDARRGYFKTTSEGKTIPLHTLLLGYTPLGLECDHKNRYKWDNRRSNLRFVTKSINRRNVDLRADNKSGFKGVSWSIKINRWRVYVQRNGKMQWIGNFKSLEDAVSARARAENKA